MDVIHRRVTESIVTALTDSPVVFLQGARQTGKSTLVRSLATRGYSGRYLTLDDTTVLAAATSDPAGFLEGMDGSVIIDEVQRAPALAVAIKAAVDRNRRPGSFLLTGSANFLILPKLAESLAGRIEIQTLWPFSEGELPGKSGADGKPFIDAIFGRQFKPVMGRHEPWASLTERFSRGGFPEMRRREEPARRRAWFEAYITTILQRDVRDIASIRDLADMPRLLAMVASRAAALLDYADLSRGLAMPQTTLKRYIGLLEATFLIRSLPAWSVNIGKRLVKSPKVLVSDTGLLVHLIGADAKRLQQDRMLGGSVLENFVAMELTKQRGWSAGRPNIFHFRTYNGEEVDLVLENPAGNVVGVEVKASATLTARDFNGLRLLAEAAGERFVRGIVLYTGTETVSFGKALQAVPISALWSEY